MGGGGGEHFRSIRIIMCKSPSGPSSVMTFVYALKLGGGGVASYIYIEHSIQVVKTISYKLWVLGINVFSSETHNKSILTKFKKPSNVI